jgi:hypothetical protein
MGKTSGVLVMLAGFGLATYVMLPANKPTASSTDEFEIRLTQGVPTKSERGTSQQATFPRTLVRSSQQPVGDGAQLVQSTPSVVTVPPHPRSAVRLAVSPTSTPGVMPTDRTQLARELQRELRRVGCYDGEINGGWTTSTKRAMKTFTERVNASLPVEEPDLVLLSLVRGQSERTCGLPCPAGESAGEGGRCVPTAVATSPRKPALGHGHPREAATPVVGGMTTTVAPVTGAADGASPNGSDATTDEAVVGTLAAPAGLTRQPALGTAGYGAPVSDGRGAMAPDRGPRRFEPNTFFRRLDKHSAN